MLIVKTRGYLVGLLTVAIFRCLCADPVVNMCDPSDTENSFIYCYGRILKAANYFDNWGDSKTFVDQPLKMDPNTTYNDFVNKYNFTSDNFDPSQNSTFKKFRAEYFYEAGGELDTCIPSDWKPNPPKLLKIKDDKLRNWAMKIHAIWKLLCKQMKKKVERYPSRHSLIYVPNQFIAPGGRFREFYYWDTYWIIKGLLVSGMYRTVESMIRNLVYVQRKYGFVPNGGRVYYLRRSQPPFLIPMVYEYYLATKNDTFVKEVLNSLESEFQFWEQNRRVDVRIGGSSYKMFQYHTKSNVPRPESYKEDIKTASFAPQSRRQWVWQNLASTAESGWDFSSRWFKEKENISTVETINIVPVDLNAILCLNMDILQFFFKLYGNFSKASEYEEKRLAFRKNFLRVFFNSSEGAWFDWNLRTKSHNTDFYPSVAVPLFAGCYNFLDTFKPRQVFDYMGGQYALKYPGGVPTSKIPSGQQWDLPNGWPPLNHMIIEGLRKSNDPEMQEAGYQLAKKWVQTSYKMYELDNKGHHMYEKINVVDILKVASGGEYGIQIGFGWTNGVILDLLHTYGDRLTAPLPNSSPSILPHETYRLIFTVIFACFLGRVI